MNFDYFFKQFLSFTGHLLYQYHKIFHKTNILGYRYNNSFIVWLKFVVVLHNDLVARQTYDSYSYVKSDSECVTSVRGFHDRVQYVSA